MFIKAFKAHSFRILLIIAIINIDKYFQKDD